MIRRFPRLRRRAIAIGWGAEDELFFYTADTEPYLIAVNRSLEGAPRRALEGGIAHELCHIDADLRLGIYPRELAWNRYLASRWYRMRNERATEQQAIALGYGRHLLALIRFARLLGCLRGNTGCCTPKFCALTAPCGRGSVSLVLAAYTEWHDPSLSGLPFPAGAGG